MLGAKMMQLSYNHSAKCSILARIITGKNCQKGIPKEWMKKCKFKQKINDGS